MRLTDRLLLALGLTALVPLVFALSVGYANARTLLEDAVESRFESVAAVQESRWNGFYASARTGLDAIAEDPGLAADFLVYRDDPGDPEKQAMLSERLATIAAASPVLDDISIVTLDGVVNMSTRPLLVGASFNLSEAPSPFEGPELRLDRILTDWNVYFMTAVEWEEERVYLVGHIDVGLFSTWVETFPERGRTGEVLFAMRDTTGTPRYVSLSRLDPHLTVGAVVERDWPTAVMRAFQGEAGTVRELQDHRGEDVLAATRILPGGVTLVVKMDSSEAFVPLVDLQVQTIGAVFIFLVVLGGAATWVSFTVSRPLVTVTTRAREIAGGRHERRIFPSGDQELRVIAESVNRLAARLEEAERTLTERVRAATAELRRSNQELEQFAYVASHDLKEPIRMVHSYLSLIERRFPERIDDELGQFLGYAKDGAERMQRLVDDLLVYSRVGRRGRAPAAVSLDDVVRLAVRDLRVLLEEHEGQVVWKDLPTVQGDRAQLVQLIENLVSNAVKFRDEQPPHVVVDAVEDRPGWHRVRVTDNGIGIAPEHRERIFDLFQRLHTREEYPGTGIGLAVCKKIVDRHGGRIGVDSGPGGVGSRFWFTLPAVPMEVPLQGADEEDRETFDRRIEELV